MARHPSSAPSDDWDTEDYTIDGGAYHPPAYQGKTLSDAQTVELLSGGGQQYATQRTTTDTKHLEGPNILPRIMYNWWLWEISGAILSMAAIIAIIAVLASHDGDVLSEWNYSITINSLISLFATVAKAALLLPVGQVIGQLKWIWFHQRARRLDHLQTFDDASRGPWGALQLLYSTRGKARLAAWGAFITLAALAIDPFTQQVITFESRQVASGSAAVGRCQNWTTNSSIITSGRIVIPTDIGFQAKAAIYSGLYGSSEATPVPIDCPSGNCTWPLFTSLGLCSKCVDVTQQTNRSCHAQLMNFQDAPSSYTQLNCTYSLPYSTWLNATFLWADNSEEMTETQYTNVASVGHWLGSPQDTSDLRVAGLSSIKLNASKETVSSWTRVEGVPIPAVEATQCILYFCIQQFNVSMSNGKLSSVNTDTTHNIPFLDLNPDGSSGVREFPFNLTAPASFTIGEQLPDYLMVDYPSPVPATTFVVNNWILEALVGALDRIFTVSPTNIDAGAALLNVGQDIAEVLYYGEDLPTVMDDVATSFSNYLRGLGGPNDHAIGTMWKMEAFIHVRWGWLVLPIVVVLMGFLFLLAAVVRNRRLAVWKSSILAILFHGLGDSRRGEMLGLLEMENTARGMMVRLKERQEGGWGLVNAGEGL